MFPCLMQHQQGERNFPFPPGLKELANDICREVLRQGVDRVDDICLYIADYLDALLIAREATILAPQIVNTILCEDLTMDQLLIHKYKCSLNLLNKYATAIQSVWRGFRTRRELLTVIDYKRRMLAYLNLPFDYCFCKLEKSAIVIQNAIRRYLQRYSEQRMWLELLQRIFHNGYTLDDATKAAIKIQRYYRYFKDRLDQCRKEVCVFYQGNMDYESSEEEEGMMVVDIRHRPEEEQLPMDYDLSDILLGFDISETHKIVSQKLESVENIDPIGSFFDLIQKEYKYVVTLEEYSSSSDSLIMEIPSQTHKYPWEYIVGEDSSDNSDSIDYPIVRDPPHQSGRRSSKRTSFRRSRYTVVIKDTDMMKPIEVAPAIKPKSRISFQEPLTDQDSEDSAEKAYKKNYKPKRTGLPELRD